MYVKDELVHIGLSKLHSLYFFIILQCVLKEISSGNINDKIKNYFAIELALLRY